MIAGYFLRKLVFSLVVVVLGTGGITLSASNLAFGANTEEPVRLVPGENYYRELMTLLSGPFAANDSIDVLHFNFFTESGQTRKIAEKLKQIKAANPGLSIRIILEGEKDAERPNGAATRNKLTEQFFQGSGVELRFISGLRGGGIKGVTHAKAIRVGDVLLSGSTNLTNTSVAKNNEFNVLVRSKLIAVSFADYVSKLIADSSKLYGVSAQDQTIRMLTDSMYFDEAVDLISQAKEGESLDITTYFFAYRNNADVKAKRMYDEIVNAHKRGVIVRVFLERNANVAVNQEITKANLQVAKLLDEAGIKTVYLDSPEKISHAKIIKYAGAKTKVVLLGSTNLYRGDFDENHQVNFLIANDVLVDQISMYLNQKFAYEATAFHNLQGGSKPVPMLRFWLGYKQADTDLSTFVKNLNTSLIPELPEVAVRRGLMAYVPIIPSENKTEDIPDEVALIVYSSDEAYNAIRTTPRGSKYGPLHFAPGLFAKETEDGKKSGSLVPTPWTGEAGVGKAYLVGAPSADWQTGDLYFRILKRPDVGFDDKSFLAAVNRHIESFDSLHREGKINAAVFAVSETSVMEILRFDHAADARAVFALAEELPKLMKVKIFSQPAGAINISEGEGVTVRSDTMLLPLDQIMKPVLEAF